MLTVARPGVSNHFGSRATSGFQHLSEGRTDFFQKQFVGQKKVSLKKISVYYNIYILFYLASDVQEWPGVFDPK